MLLQKLIDLFSSGVLRTSLLWYLLAAPHTVAQIVPDNTLPQNSIVTPDGDTIDIDGGTRTGNNLFHSFEQFSVPANFTADFKNSAEIQNILSRVTGGSISEINGRIKTRGVANLFLINPNGIIFGEQASLNVGGSFFATSADSIIFKDGSQFNATNPNHPPLLTINVPVGLWFRENPGAIINRSGTTVRERIVDEDREEGFRLRLDRQKGLSVESGQTLGLIGGEVIIDEGFLNAEGGRIELGSVGENSFVGFSFIDNKFEFDYQNVLNFRDINIGNESRVIVRGDGGGDVQIQGRQVTLSQGSLIEGTTEGDQPGGTLEINAQESINLLERSIIRANVDPKATAEGADILLNAERLSIRDGSTITVETTGIGNGGDIIINANDIEVFGRYFRGPGPDNFVRSTIVNQIDGEGRGNPSYRRGGNIIIKTERLTIGAEEIRGNQRPAISTTLRGIGNAGDIHIQASESIELTNGGIQAGINANTEKDNDNIGNAGDITIETGRLLVTEGSFVSSTVLGQGTGSNVHITATDIEVSNPSGISRGGILAQVNIQGTGNAGSVTINTERLTVRDGEFISVSTENQGSAGTLVINATEVELVGQASETTRSENIGPSELLVGLPKEQSRGVGGNLDLNTERLIIRDGAQISGLSIGSGDGGNVEITASDILLEDGNGIIARAEERSAGGNISIDTNSIIIRDSDILATAEAGRGGNIDINAEVFIQDDSSRIDASSALGIDGTVTLNTPAIDPSSGLIDFPQTPVDVTTLVGQDPCSQTQNSEFVNVGRGGLPPSPQESLRSEETIVELIELNSEADSHVSSPTNRTLENRQKTSNQPISSLNIIPAMGWIRNENGDVILVSYDPTQTGVQRPRIPGIQCQP